MVYRGSDCGGGGCHCGARGGHRHLLPEGPLPGEGVHTKKRISLTVWVRGGYWKQDPIPLVSKGS